MLGYPLDIALESKLFVSCYLSSYLIFFLSDVGTDACRLTSITSAMLCYVIAGVT